jgi:hypothetical protein
MFTLILVSHIILLSLSIGVSASSLFAVITKHSIRPWIVTANTAITTVGLSFGALLLFNSPLSNRCAFLLAYLIAFTGLQIFITRRSASTHTVSER